MKKLEFNMSVHGSDPIPTKAYPIVFTRQDRAWRFALHKSGREWIVSDPVSGKRVCRVSATYKGVPVASGTLTIKQAMQASLIDLDAIVDRMGFDTFAAVLDRQVTA